MNTLAKDIIDYLDSEDVLTSGTDLFWGNLPTGVDAGVSVKDISGPDVDDLMGGSVLDRSMVQITSRHKTSKATAVANLNSVLTALKSAGKVTINGTSYIGFWATTIFDLDKDDNDRHVLGVHVRTVRT